MFDGQIPIRQFVQTTKFYFHLKIMANNRIKIKGECGMRYHLTNFAFILSIFFCVYGLPCTGLAEDLKKESKQLIGIFKVVDGSSLSFDGKIYKLYGAQGPASRQKCKKGSLPWLCGAAAKKFLLQQTDGLVLRCGVREATVVQCFLKGRDLSVVIIRAGWAVANIERKAHKKAEAYARKNGLGLWPKK